MCFLSSSFGGGSVVVVCCWYFIFIVLLGSGRGEGGIRAYESNVVFLFVQCCVCNFMN